MNWHSRGVDVCNSGLRRILLPRAAAAVIVVVVAAAATAATAVVGSGLLGECRECKEVATP